MLNEQYAINLDSWYERFQNYIYSLKIMIIALFILEKIIKSYIYFSNETNRLTREI